MIAMNSCQRLNQVMKTIGWIICSYAVATAMVMANDWANLDGATGNIFKVDTKSRSFELLKETAYAPKSTIGQSRFTVHWSDQTQVVMEKERKDLHFDLYPGPLIAEFKGIDAANRKAMKAGQPFEARVATLYSGLNPELGVMDEGNRVVGRFNLHEDPRSGMLEVDGRFIKVTLRKKFWRIYVNIKWEPRQLGGAFWKTEVHGAIENERFVVSQMKVWQLPDPRLSDDPKLPRVLIVGDSISMNYFEVAKESLKGTANLHRNQGNAFSTSQGVRNMELWLGDYQEKGFHWDVIQFNHGLHDLKQKYDKGTDVFGAYAVPLEDYKANLEKQIAILKKTGAQLIWCMTTPIPNHNKGQYARRKGASAEFNQAAMEVMKRHPEILITDLYKVVDQSPVFDNWRKGIDVHFYKEEERKVMGQEVASIIRKASKK
jgi:hypothetical protein